MTLFTSDRSVVVPRSVAAPKQFICRSILRLDAGSGFVPPGYTLASRLVVSDVWTSIATLYDQFYVTEWSLNYMPFNRYNRGVTTSTAPFLCAYDVDDVIVNSYTTAQIVDKITAKFVSMDDPWEIAYKVPKDVSKGGFQWKDVASPTGFTGAVYFDSPTPVSPSTLQIGYLIFSFKVVARSTR